METYLIKVLLACTRKERKEEKSNRKQVRNKSIHWLETIVCIESLLKCVREFRKEKKQGSSCNPLTHTPPAKYFEMIVAEIDEEKQMGLMARDFPFLCPVA